jgi:hypothetical protein
MPRGKAAGMCVIATYGGVFRQVALTACAAIREVRVRRTAVPASEPNRPRAAIPGARGRHIDLRPNWKEQPAQPTVLRNE